MTTDPVTLTVNASGSSTSVPLADLVKMFDPVGKYSRDEPTGNPHLGATEDVGLSVDIYMDGTATHAEVAFEGGVIGTGVARRRKGDTRDPDIGIALAMARALRAASDGYFAIAEAMLR